MWWIRNDGNFRVATKYARAGLLAAARSKSADAGDVLEAVPFETSFRGGEIVSYTVNSGELKPISREYPSGGDGQFKVYYTLDSDFELHPESYETLARANMIVKKYLRKHYRKVLVVC
jgi:hypothetical protein